MALIDCPECKNPVSDIAPTCPTCGLRFPDNLSLLDRLQKISAIVVAATVPIVGAVYTYHKDSARQLAEKTAEEAQRLAQVEAREAQELAQVEARHIQRLREEGEISTKRADRAMQVLDRLAQKNDRSASAMMALYFASVGELHNGIVSVLARTAMDEDEFKDDLKGYLEEMSVKVAKKANDLEAEIEIAQINEEKGRLEDRLKELVELSQEIAEATEFFNSGKYYAKTKDSKDAVKKAEKVVELAETSGGNFLVPLVKETFAHGAQEQDQAVEDKATEAVIQGLKAAARDANAANEAIAVLDETNLDADKGKKAELQDKANKAIQKAHGLVEATKSASQNGRADILRKVIDGVSMELNAEQREAVLGKIAEVSESLEGTERSKILREVTEDSESLNDEQSAAVLGKVTDATEDLEGGELTAVLHGVTEMSKNLDDEQNAEVLGKVADASESLEGGELTAVLHNVTEGSKTLDDEQSATVLGKVADASERLGDEQRAEVLQNVTDVSKDLDGEQGAEVLGMVASASESLGDKQRAEVLQNVTEVSKDLDGEQSAEVLGMVADASESLGDEQRAEVLQDVTDVSKNLGSEQRTALLEKVNEASRELAAEEREMVFEKSEFNRIVIKINHENQRELGELILESIKGKWPSDSVGVIENVSRENGPEIPPSTQIRFQKDPEGEDDNQKLAEKIREMVDRQLTGILGDQNIELQGLNAGLESVVEGEFEVWFGNDLGKENLAPADESEP